ncbi:MAG: hypothetical protein GYA24_10030 [Candidatus Lokiarchaeota archaeon]|nr:hypothetical protein [Candidatus Lokiarchaeota archaeon]
MLRAVLLSAFDVRLGPTVVLSVPSFSQKELEQFNVVPRLIDVAGTEGFFLSTLEKVYSANYYFTIENTSTRGNKDMLLLSIAVQVSSDDDKEKILLFLKNAEDALREQVRGIQENEPINEMGILAAENASLVSHILHGLFDSIFDKGQFDVLVKRGHDRIGIFTHPGFDAARVIDFFRKELHKERNPPLRTRLVINAIDEISYDPFYCKERQSGNCLKDECPACAEIVKESEAIIYMFDSGTFKMDLHFNDMFDYLKSIDKAKRVPVLVMQVDMNPSVDGVKVYEDLTARLQEEIQASKLTIQPRHARVPLGNMDAFKECMSWLIKAII